MRFQLLDLFDPVSKINAFSPSRWRVMQMEYRGAVLWVLYFPWNTVLLLRLKPTLQYDESCVRVKRKVQLLSIVMLSAISSRHTPQITLSPRRMRTWCDSRNHRENRVRIRQSFIVYGILMQNIEWWIYTQGNFYWGTTGIHPTEFAHYWGYKKNATVQDLARHETSLTKFQIGSQNFKTPWHYEMTKNRSANNKGIGPYANNIESNSSLSMNSSRKSPSYPWSPLTAMPIWHQHHQHSRQRQQALRSFSPLISTTSIDGVHYCSFWLYLNYPFTPCSAVMPQIWATLTNMREANSPLK